MLGDVEETIYVAEEEDEDEPPRVRVSVRIDVGWLGRDADCGTDGQETVGDAVRARYDRDGYIIYSCAHQSYRRLGSPDRAPGRSDAVIMQDFIARLRQITARV